ncbi:MAG: vanadium-dependent haloperoxidase [Bryobacteraceae bacterium]
MEGADCHALWMLPPPKFSSADEVAEILENYWMALARDIPFNDYPGSAGNGILDAAFANLSGFAYYTIPSQFFGALPLTRDALFRGTTLGDRRGPYVSQFLLVDTPYGAQSIPARIRTVQPGVDYMTSYFEWLDVQNGCDSNQSACDPMPRLIRSGRDLAQLVHVDADFNAHYNACFILGSGRDPLRRCEASAGFGVAFEKHLPYLNPATPPSEEYHRKSRTQIGVGTFGIQHVKSLLMEVVTRAAKAVWFQKWQVHRRLRPEEFGARIHRQRIEPIVAHYPIHSALFNSPLFSETGDHSIFRHNFHQNCDKRCRRHCEPHETDPHPLDTKGTYLLPMAYAEGCPIHPSYGAGHATIAGACVTILKAFFADGCIINPVIANRNGTALEPYTGLDRDELTIHGELNKLASNISLARNIAGVHWRSDHTQSLLLGEKVAISLLFDQRKTYNEDYQFRFRRFDDVSHVVIDKSTTVAQLASWLA